MTIPIGLFSSVAGRRFNISPSVSGKSTWDLDVDGIMSITTAGSYTFTPLSSFSCVVEAWGPGGNGGSVFGAPTADSPATTFDGLSAGGGRVGGSITAGAGGTATGGDINSNGNGGSNGQNNTITNCVGGAGGTSPNGGTGGAQVVDSNSGGTEAQGNSGNAPGGGASGGATYRGNNSGQGAGGGGGGGAYLLKNISTGHFVIGSDLTIVVGASPTFTLGNGTGGRGAAGKFKIT